ncbi:MAG TPA: dienelactone hydrolase family protein [Bryobacteraceae bacterium]|nr:dienelactone hydrolase family protein [Bryobacteraceae bacterium]
MKKLLLSVLLVVCSVSAQDWARQKLEKSPRHGEWVTVKHDGRSVETFVAYPESRAKTPVVLVIHEIFGMSDWVQDLADQLAEAGYIAVAPDLLSGAGPNGGGTKSLPSGEVGQAIGKLPPDQITADLNAVADYGLKLPASNGKLFVAGFCYGGTQTFRFATNRPDLKGAFVFYGSAPSSGGQGPFTPDPAALARIKAPVLGFYAGNDARIGATVPATQEAMKAAGKTYDPVTYEGAGHGFMREGEDPGSTNPMHAANVKARNEAWTRWKELLAKYSK